MTDSICPVCGGYRSANKALGYAGPLCTCGWRLPAPTLPGGPPKMTTHDHLLEVAKNLAPTLLNIRLLGVFPVCIYGRSTS